MWSSFQLIRSFPPIYRYLQLVNSPKPLKYSHEIFHLQTTSRETGYSDKELGY